MGSTIGKLTLIHAWAALPLRACRWKNEISISVTSTGDQQAQPNLIGADEADVLGAAEMQQHCPSLAFPAA